MPTTTYALAALVCFTLACDAAPPSDDCPAVGLAIALPEDADADLAFRETPEASYIKTLFGKEIHAAEFSAAVTACSKVGDPVLLLTLSAYKPLLAGDVRVVGLGGSMYADGELWACLSKMWTANGAIKL